MTTLRADPVTEQIVGNALASIADEMATTIFRTAHSTVVRDGMDFSAALCDARGETVAQAVTVPFHLGSVPHAMTTLRAGLARTRIAAIGPVVAGELEKFGVSAQIVPKDSYFMKPLITAMIAALSA